MFNVDSKPITYHLRTCSGLVEAHGREAEGFQIESLDGKVLISLPTLLEIPNNRNEIPTPTAVLHQPHLHHIAKHIPELDHRAQILLLLGRDVIRAHKVRQQVNGPHNAPFAQRLDLGWVVMGEVCLGNTHKPTIHSMKTNVWENGRHSIFLPCTIRTRGGQAESKPWAMMFTCLSSRAVHIELIESMDTSSCINALRRFFALRGPANQLHSDCGTNFTGACKELGMNKAVQNFLSEKQCIWKFNPPHASHMGGSWERMIGIARRILDSMLLKHGTRITHEVLCTLMAEVTAIINARPLLPVSIDPQQPFILSPSMLLTQKAGAPPPPGEFTERDLYTKQWKQVQAFANQFWSRWRMEYLPSLQQRQKWNMSRRNLQVGDLVLLKDKQAARNYWPMAMVTATFPGIDNLVRKVEVKTTDQGTPKTFLRPVTEVVLFLPKD
ncbi:uncharacterized protein LOC133556345 [Nerophis ophidion]|uniref:uncharacterized protein LOC133556345 n=1 Tax=Nerophis ophidion TaxID=159077 RepID=UPI002AE08FA4|nr:uncharacterized protein LOC133556345 [Nerophis ophidion]XP_061762158.1 uncharacterized protein LOC133556345 [Nerophis ophidion]